MYAFRRIQNLNNVGEATGFPLESDRFLISVENEMAVYTRCVRQQCKFNFEFFNIHVCTSFYYRILFFCLARPRSVSSGPRDHDYGFLDRNNVCSVSVAQRALR